MESHTKRLSLERYMCNLNDFRAERAAWGDMKSWNDGKTHVWEVYTEVGYL